jgi:hypothetical protein
MAKKTKPSENQLGLFVSSDPDSQQPEDREIHGAREAQQVESRSAPDDHPILVQWREQFISDHCQKYPDGLCVYFRYEFRIEDHS